MWKRKIWLNSFFFDAQMKHYAYYVYHDYIINLLSQNAIY